MRITFLLPGFDLTGGNRVLAIYAEGLQRRGHQVLALAPIEPKPSLLAGLRSLLKGQGWPKDYSSGPSHFDGLDVEHYLVQHPGALTDADVPDADVIVATWWETAAWAEAMAAAKGARVYFMQDYEIFGGPEDRVDASCRLPMPKIVIAGWMRELLQTKFQQEPLALVPNSVDPTKFYAPPRGRQAVPTVGMIYATNRNKGTDVCIKAYERAAKEIPSLRLVSMGNCQVATEMPLPRGAEFTFKARDQALRDIYSRCDAWLFGTRMEGFGLPILEAMACRTPVIGTPAGAAPDLLVKGGGILVSHEDPESMARAIVKVCSLPDIEWRALSDAALATATGYTWDDAIGLFEDALKKVAEGGR